MGVRLAGWRGRAGTARAVAGITIAGLLAAGCTHESASQRLALASCTRFAIHVIERHLTIRSLPAACHGLTRAQVNAAADAALAETAGKVRRVKGARITWTRPLLGYPLASFAAQPNPPPVTTVASPPAGGPPLALVALVTWLITVAFGGLMLARWALRGRRRQAGGGQVRSLPAMNVAHFGLALAGLAAWIGYLVTGLTGVAWVACALLLPVAGFGMVLVSRWFPERSTADPAVSAAAPRPVAASAISALGPSGAAPGKAVPDLPPAGGTSGPPPVRAVPGRPPARHPPALIVATHVAFATATILFAVLAAIAAR
jgi:hypothetical protein